MFNKTIYNLNKQINRNGGKKAFLCSKPAF